MKTNLAHFNSIIDQHPVLSNEETIRLIDMAQSGDREAVQKLVSSNLRLVLRVVRPFRNSGVPVEDLVAEGNIGLLKAIETFDPKKGMGWASFAIMLVRQHVIRALSQYGRVVRLPRHIWNLVPEVQRLTATVNGGNEPIVDFSDLSARLGCTRNTLEGVMLAQRGEVSIDAEVSHSKDNRGSSLIEMLSDSDGQEIQQAAEFNDLASKLEIAMQSLSEREQRIIRLHFGLQNEQQEESFAQIGKKMNLSRERVRQITNDALEKLRKALS